MDRPWVCGRRGGLGSRWPRHGTLWRCLRGGVVIKTMMMNCGNRRETKEQCGGRRKEGHRKGKKARRKSTPNQEKQRIEANAAAEISLQSELTAALAFLTSHGPDCLGLAIPSVVPYQCRHKRTSPMVHSLIYHCPEQQHAPR